VIFRQRKITLRSGWQFLGSTWTQRWSAAPPKITGN